MKYVIATNKDFLLFSGSPGEFRSDPLEEEASSHSSEEEIRVGEEIDFPRGKYCVCVSIRSLRTPVKLLTSCLSLN